MGLLKKLFKSNKTSEELLKNVDLIDGLPWGWINENLDFTGPRDGKLFELSKKYNNASSIDDEINKIQEFIDYYYKYQKECKDKGIYFYRYFENMHMHCHNSKNNDFEFVELAQERLQYINSHKYEVIKKYKQKEEDYQKYLKYRDPLEDNLTRIKKNDFSYNYINIDKRDSEYSNSTNTYISTAGKRCIEYENTLSKRIENYKSSICPYCNKIIQLPKRTKKCEFCKNKIYIVNSKISQELMVLTENEKNKLSELRDIFYNDRNYNPNYENGIYVVK